jgi:hypothetical protein
MLKFITGIPNIFGTMKIIMILIVVLSSLGAVGYGAKRYYSFAYNSGIEDQKKADQKIFDEQTKLANDLQKKMFQISDQLSQKSISFEQSQAAQTELEGKLINAANKNVATTCNFTPDSMSRISTALDASAKQYPH